MTKLDETFQPPVFDHLGGHAPECSEADKQRMRPEARKAYEHAHRCANDCAEIELAITQGEAAIKEQQRAIDLKKRDVHQYRPAPDAFSEWQKTVKGIAPTIDPEREAMALEAEKIVLALESELVVKLEALEFSKRAVRDARKRQGDGWDQYIRTYHKSPTVDEALKAVATQGAVTRAANVAAGRRPEDNRPQNAPAFQSVIDAVRANSRGSAGHSRQVGARPGSFPASAYGRKVAPPKVAK